MINFKFCLLFFLPLATGNLIDTLKEFNLQVGNKMTELQIINMTSCQIEAQILKNLTRSIKDIADYVPRPSHTALTVKEPYFIEIPDNVTDCRRAILYLASSVHKFSIYSLVMLVDGPTLTEAELNYLHQLCDVTKTQLQQSVNQFSQKLDEITQHQQTLTSRTERVFKTQLQKKKREHGIQQTITEINNNNLENAKTIFINLNKTELINTIIEKIPDQNNNEKVLNFIKILPWLSQRLYGYRAMLLRSNLGSSIFLLKTYFDELMQKQRDPQLVAEYQELINTIQQEIENQIKEINKKD